MPSLKGIDDEGSGFGVAGISDNGFGVVGDSQSGFGVRGSSESGIGVRAFSQSGDGVVGQTHSGDGVAGDSNYGAGVSGYSEAGVGIVGSSSLGTGVEGNAETKAGVIGRSRADAGIVGFSEEEIGVFGFGEAGVGVLGAGPLGGVRGISQQTEGVAGRSFTGVGVYGESEHYDGVAGYSPVGVGVYGESGRDNGVLGVTINSSRAGVFGVNLAPDGSGVVGLGAGEQGIGVFGQGTRRGTGVVANGSTGVSALGHAGPGVKAISESRDGIVGISRGKYFTGVYGVHEGDGDGVLGQGHNGVRGEGHNGIQGQGYKGVLGIATSDHPNGAGVHGKNPTPGAAAVRGDALDGYGVVGLCGVLAGTEDLILNPYATSAGVIGCNSKGAGVVGVNMGDSDVGGVFAMGSPMALTALGNIFCGGTLIVFSEGTSGIFIGDINVEFGNVSINQNLMVGGLKLFHIDHPLDPRHKYLNHACVESSEMKTVYDGVAILDAQGEAIIELPEWFEALNTDFRYQLTPVGAPAPNLHVATEVSSNRFTIAGGSARLKVCWQVTGVRHDPVALAQPLVVETDKPAEERGFFLRPEAYGQPAECGVAWARNPELMRRAQQERKRGSSE